MIILRSLTSLNFNWYKRYDKNAKNENDFFLQNGKKQEMEMFAFCVITFELLRFKHSTGPGLRLLKYKVSPYAPS